MESLKREFCPIIPIKLQKREKDFLQDVFCNLLKKNFRVSHAKGIIFDIDQGRMQNLKIFYCNFLRNSLLAAFTKGILLFFTLHLHKNFFESYGEKQFLCQPSRKVNETFIYLILFRI